ncbi:Hypothetical predicted protein [Paramuricea clavata]|uniref:Uncharacterized protein n=1 Tax=Paramuricea clavata TaxID=317549 RepID=A0A6S7FQL3_PARCT|nr:Hypothetical predicted protein [Paramuricea clavata]
MVKLATDLVKFVDDSTAWDVLHRDSQSNLPSTVKACEEWTCDNNMKLNASKTKEMRVNFSSSSPSYPPIVINNQIVNIVTHAKLPGVTISNDLKWNLHVSAICKKASKRLYALWLLKKRPSGLRPSPSDAHSQRSISVRLPKHPLRTTFP